jgi:signal transduction histidine kinase
MISLVVVLMIIMAGANILNYRKVIKDADEILAVLMENDGKFPQTDNNGDGKENLINEEMPQLENPGPADDEENPDNVENNNAPDMEKTDDVDKKQKGFSMTGIMSPETPYETRFFSVLLDDSGNTISVDTGKIAAIDTSEARNYAYNVFQQKKEKGFVDVYRYVKKETVSGVRVIFLDCSRNMASFRSFLVGSMIISFVGILAVLLLMVIFSNRIVKPMAESYEKQKQFITDAGHEIKTPLSVIQADTELLEMDCGEDNEWICDIQNQIKRMTDLTNDLICLARMEEGQNSLRFMEFPFSDVVEEAVQFFQAPAKTKNITISQNIEDMISVKGDEKALRQMVTILLDNAIKYCPEAGHVFITLERKNKSVYFRVKNNTVNSPDSQQINHLFDRFYRTDESRNSQTGGFGIGLSIAKAVVDAHKGKISARVTEENSLQITVVLLAA